MAPMPDKRITKRISVLPHVGFRMTEAEVSRLHLECEAALREWDDERAQMLFTLIEDEAVVDTNPDRA